jgi:Protein of unknown function (DUF1064)
MTKKAWHTHFKRKAAAERTYEWWVFDSVSEMQRYAFLRLLEKQGEIYSLENQVRFPLIIYGKPCTYETGRTVEYFADFRFRLRTTDEVVIEDFKGFDEKVSRIKRAVVEAIYGIKIRVVKGVRDDPRIQPAPYKKKPRKTAPKRI